MCGGDVAGTRPWFDTSASVPGCSLDQVSHSAQQQPCMCCRSFWSSPRRWTLVWTAAVGINKNTQTHTQYANSENLFLFLWHVSVQVCPLRSTTTMSILYYDHLFSTIKTSWCYMLWMNDVLLQREIIWWLWKILSYSRMWFEEQM